MKTFLRQRYLSKLLSLLLTAVLRGITAVFSHMGRQDLEKLSLYKGQTNLSMEKTLFLGVESAALSNNHLKRMIEVSCSVLLSTFSTHLSKKGARLMEIAINSNILSDAAI